MTTTDKKQYDTFARKYSSIEDLPCSRVEGQLIRIALGDCTGLTVLDLGGGSGIHARKAIEAGAAVVDVFDISTQMLGIGEELESQLGRHGRIRWFEADATRPLAEQVRDGVLPSNGYDVVMVNWTFDHSTCMEDLTGMWQNVVENLKPGGRFLGVRVQNVRAGHVSYGKYGVKYNEVDEIPGGFKYIVEHLTEPPFSFGATSMESNYSLADEIPRKLGLIDFEVIRPEETDEVKSDLAFWDDFLRDPSFTVVVAKKP
ncbi:S-adenosyl-L-methionine-dependent methyltransferase [Thozetella sp. PMI_491]|nr:S-adenosyl-L-methionine-dependent methyltransferase [Thozetella sp. PMI_491]